ncbi:reverse transcriptase/ribonuclease h/methyltransferase [Plakobranchus ocellatus]|uniref:Reverse transcriptase/ribonuclease h/methyltransferase n=1 Tax=Plakobranchus ocellatus TaxID=259542 RepID=A0AAV3Z7X2_9GAST|nr:reverse transcriptase/ribonuclease h/methyltransferase [Plakobranchus ocellatus]
MQKIDTFVKALIKADTKRPAGRTKVMPTNNFVKLFKNWGANENLSLRRLRQKAVTLLALTAMCRPSDLAPRVGFMRDQIHFNDDGSMTVLFYGIKNDTDRHGFEVRIGRSECVLTDPVLCLKDYIRRTNQNITESQKQPVFITLLPPFKALSAQSVGTILRQSIADAGLDESFTPRSYRPTGATEAVVGGVEPYVARSLGRWKSEEVFASRYVYPLSTKSATDSILNAQLPFC